MNSQGVGRAALIAGVATGVLSALPLLGLVNCLCCAWAIGGGILASYLYVRASPVSVTLGRGIVLGLATGAVAAAVDTAFSIPIHFALAGLGVGTPEEIGGLLRRFPEVPAEYAEQLRALLAGGTGVMLLLAAGLVKLVVYALAGTLGGAVGVAIFEKRPPGTAVFPDARYGSASDGAPPVPPATTDM